MNAVDARARRAASAIHESLATAAPPAPFATVVRRAAIAKVVNLAIVGTGIAMFIAAGAAFRTPQPLVPVADVVTSTTTEAPPLTTTLAPPDDHPQVVALPTTTEPVPTTEPARPTTSAPITTPPTTTTEAPPTTTTTKPPSTTTKPPDITKPPDTTPPAIAITFPENRMRFARPAITMKGTTEPGATVTMGKHEADMGDEGLWRLRLELRPGRNRLVVTAADAAGNTAQDVVVVFYEPPDIAPFSAHATFGSCELDPPYDVYYGRGEPGSAISVISKYGSGSTRVDLDGGWEVKVFFPEAPSGEVFRVRVADEYGRSKTFEFVSNVPA